MEEAQLSLFADDAILQVRNTKDSTKKLLELINSVKLQGTKSTCKNQLGLYTLTMNNPKGNEENPVYNCIKNNKILVINNRF